MGSEPSTDRPHARPAASPPRAGDPRPTPAPRPARSPRSALPPRWQAFAGRLAAVLAVLEDDQFVVVEDKLHGHYVQFAAQGGSGMLGEAVPTEGRPGERVLDRRQVRQMAALGWAKPTVSRRAHPGEAPSPEDCPNFWRRWEHPAPFAAIAELAVATLRECYGVVSPSSLGYKAASFHGRTILLPTLGLTRLPLGERQRDGDSLRARVLACVRAATGLADLEFDADGDITICRGSVRFYLRLHEPSSWLEMFGAILFDPDTDEGLADAVNEINRRTHFVGLFVSEHGVHASASLLLTPFSPEQLAACLDHFSQTCDVLDDELQARFGGQRHGDWIAEREREEADRSPAN